MQDCKVLILCTELLLGVPYIVCVQKSYFSFNLVPSCRLLFIIDVYIINGICNATSDVANVMCLEVIFERLQEHKMVGNLAFFFVKALKHLSGGSDTTIKGVVRQDVTKHGQLLTVLMSK